MRTIQNTSVCAVGGAGFLGSHLVKHLIEDRSCQVVVVDNLVVGRREFIHPRAVFEHADITESEEHLKQIFKKYDVQFVMNYAAWPYIPNSFIRPLHVFNVNATGAIKVINAAQEARVQAILQISSAEIYGDAGSIPINENKSPRIDEQFDVRPHSTYGVAKAAVDYYCQTAWRERQTPVIALRQFNCLGERETHPYVVPEIISQLSSMGNVSRELPVKIKLGNNSFRDFQYAGDAVKMATELLERGQFGEVYNMGSESGVKIYDLAETIGRLMGFEKVEIQQDPDRVRPWEIWHLQSDNSKLYSVIKTRAETTLEESLKKTIQWYEENGRRWPWERS